MTLLINSNPPSDWGFTLAEGKMVFWKFWRAIDNFKSPTFPEAVEGGAQRPLLTSLGLAIIDEIQFGSGKIVKNVLGGSATYCESQCSPLSFSTTLVHQTVKGSRRIVIFAPQR